MNDEMKEKKVIVTGSSSGIGRATAERFLQQGASVALVGRNKTALDGVASPDNRGFSVVADLSNEEQTEQCVSQAVAMLGGLDVLVNAAGILKSGRIEDTSLEFWD